MENKSPHILSTSSNLLGFSFLVFTSIKSLGLPQAGFIDEILVVLILSLTLSCLTSFLSIRTVDTARAADYELKADLLFLFSLLLIVIIAVLATFDYLIFVS
jgi:heme O synthase-like polyprenyltransferase